ncbi:hypothetical protein ABIC44_003179 [Sphingomonas sp. 1185]
MTGDLTLYTNPRSRGRIARWMLVESGASWDMAFDFAQARADRHPAMPSLPSPLAEGRGLRRLGLCESKGLVGAG